MPYIVISIHMKHALVQLNRNYYQPTNVWRNLERNWSHFFWLTGETPATLRVLVTRIEQIYLPERPMGWAQALTFENQVSSMFICASSTFNSNLTFTVEAIK